MKNHLSYLNYKMSPEEEGMVQSLFLEIGSEEVEGKLVYVKDKGFIRFELKDKWKISEGFPEKDFFLAYFKIFSPLYFRKNKEEMMRRILFSIEWAQITTEVDVIKTTELAILEVLQGVFDLREIREEADCYTCQLPEYKEIFCINKNNFSISIQK